jgi:catechol 2,3-dioxygenase-like lactoylglutathione lyase family enzyme
MSLGASAVSARFRRFGCILSDLVPSPGLAATAAGRRTTRMKTTTTPSTAVQSHVSIDTSDLARSRSFYTALFGCDPVLERANYVRFWPLDPGLVLALNARPLRERGTGSLQHLGILFRDPATLRAARERLERAGFSAPGEAHTECCYAELDQYWATDPSGVRWELFLAHREVIDSAPDCGEASGCCPSA